MPRWISAFVCRACMSAWAWAPRPITMVPDIIRPDHATGTTTITRAIVAMRSTMVQSSWKASRLADPTTIAGSTADRCSGIAAAGITGMAGRVPILAGTMAKAGAGTAVAGIAAGAMTTGVVANGQPFATIATGEAATFTVITTNTVATEATVANTVVTMANTVATTATTADNVGI